MCLNHCDGMICLEASYFSLNKMLLRAIGLWPFQQSTLGRIQFSLYFSIMISAIIFQLTAFATNICTPKFIIKVLSPAFSCTIIIINYGVFYINIETVKNILMELHYTCNQLKDENEIAIIEKYGYKGKYFTTVTTFSASFVFTLLVGQFCLDIFDVILSTNKSRSHELYVTVEYFLDQEKYFYLILLHLNVTIIIVVVTVIATGTMFFAYFQHICGMFRIASYRIEYAMKVNALQNSFIKNEHMVYKGIVCAITIHRQATKLSNLLMSSFDTTYFFMVIMGVISLSLNLFQIAISENITEILVPILIITCIMIYFFFGNYIGQHITDHNNHVFATVYNVQWYMCPLHIQKLMLFLLQRGVTEFRLTCGGLFVVSFECFASLVKASVSYFTIIHSML